MEGKPTRIKIKDTVYRIQPIPRKLICGKMALTLSEVLNRKGGLIVGEGDTGKTTYVQMLCEAAKAHDRRDPILVKLRKRPQQLEIPDVPEGEVQTIIWDGLDEYPECARDIRDLTDDLDPERYHVWVTSRPCNAASIVAGSRLLELVHHLAPFTTDDICEIARSVNLDGEAFLSRVYEAHLESFIAKPGGALILMQLFANGTLKPSDDAAHPMNTGVMETIMRDFARETRDGDAEAVPTLAYSEQEIVEATCWIAACLVFSGRDAIWTGPKSNCPANDICLGDLPPRNYGTKLFEAVLGRRLFEPLSPTRYRLAYSDMPPFLAGRWLAKYFPVEKLKELSLHPSRIESWSEPFEAIVWANAYNQTFFEPYFQNYLSLFLKCHAAIELLGFFDFFSALCKKPVTPGNSPAPPHRIGNFESTSCDLADYTAFTKFLHSVINSGEYSIHKAVLAKLFLSFCKRAPLNDSALSQDKDERINIPTESELAQRLSNPEAVNTDDLLKWIKMEKIRGFPYRALRKFFDTFVFQPQGDNDPLARPGMVGCALAYDIEKCAEHVVKRLPSNFDIDPQIKRFLPPAHTGEEYDKDDIYSDTPLSPAELDALAPSKEKPVNEMVSVVPEGFVDKVAEALAKKTKNKGGRPKKDACRRCISVKTAAELIGCPASMLENWERYERTDGETGCAPIEIVYEKNGITKRVKYTVKLRENCTLENARILRAIGKALEFAEAGKKLAAEKKIVRFKDEQKLDNMNFHHGIVRTQNPKGTC